MMDNPLYEKAIDFAERILDMSDFLLTKDKHPYSLEVCVKQITRSGSSIAANVAEGQGGQSKPDLTAKLSIAYKEGKETEMWMELLKRKGFLTEEQYVSLNNDLQEILRILIASLNTLKNK